MQLIILNPSMNAHLQVYSSHDESYPDRVYFDVIDLENENMLNTQSGINYYRITNDILRLRNALKKGGNGLGMQAGPQRLNLRYNKKNDPVKKT